MNYATRVLVFRLTMFAILGVAQGYLFIRIREVLKRTARPESQKTVAAWLIGIAIGLLYLLNAYIVVRQLTWVDPPLLAQRAQPVFNA